MNRWNTWNTNNVWKNDEAEETIGATGRQVNQSMAQIRHAQYKKQVIVFVKFNPMCTFTDIYTITGIKRTTCNTIVKLIIQDGGMQRRKIKNANGQKNFGYFVAEMPESGQLEQTANLWSSDTKVQILLSA